MIDDYTLAPCVKVAVVDRGFVKVTCLSCKSVQLILDMDGRAQTTAAKAQIFQTMKHADTCCTYTLYREISKNTRKAKRLKTFLEILLVCLILANGTLFIAGHYCVNGVATLTTLCTFLAVRMTR